MQLEFVDRPPSGVAAVALLLLGVFNQMSNPDSPLSKTELAKGVNSPDPVVRRQTFAGVLRDMSAGKIDPMLTDPAERTWTSPIWYTPMG